MLQIKGMPVTSTWDRERRTRLHLGHHSSVTLRQLLLKHGGMALGMTGALRCMDAGSPGEAGGECSEETLCVKELGCMEVLCGLGNRLGEPLWMGIRAGSSHRNIRWGVKESAMEVKMWSCLEILGASLAVFPGWDWSPTELMINQCSFTHKDKLS